MVELKPDIECKEKCFDLCHVKNHRLEMTDPAVTLHGRVNDRAGHVVVDEGIVVVGSERLVENVAFPGSIPCKKAKEWNSGARVLMSAEISFNQNTQKRTELVIYMPVAAAVALISESPLRCQKVSRS